MTDIKINKTELETLIGILEEDNKAIIQSITNVIMALETLDEKKWKSSEKKKIEEELIPYLRKIKDGYGSQLNRCTNFIKSAKEKYQSLDQTFDKTINESF